MNVLITCCGRKLFLIDEIQKSLNKLFPLEQNNVVVTESDKYSASLYYTAKGFIVPPIFHPKYIEEIIKICKQEDISILIPCKDTELKKISEHIDMFKGLLIPLSSNKTINICEDKLKFFETLKCNINMPIIHKLDSSRTDISYPCVVKERGLDIETYGAHICINEKELECALFESYNPIIQQKIEGIEYTVDSLFDNECNPICIVPRKRLRIREHVSDVGLVCNDHEIISQTQKAAKLLNIKSVANFQWIEDPYGVPYLIDVNPRISGGLQVTLAACPDFILTLIKLILGLKIHKLKFVESVLTLKYESIISCNIF